MDTHPVLHEETTDLEEARSDSMTQGQIRCVGCYALCVPTRFDSHRRQQCHRSKLALHRGGPRVRKFHGELADKVPFSGS